MKPDAFHSSIYRNSGRYTAEHGNFRCRTVDLRDSQARLAYWVCASDAVFNSESRGAVRMDSSLGVARPDATDVGMIGA